MADNFGQVGSAFIALEADIRNFQNSLRAAQPALQKIAGEAGATVGKSIDEGVEKNVNLSGVTTKITGLAKSLAATFGIILGAQAAVGVFKDLAGAALDFQQSISNVNSLLGGTDVNVGKLSDQLLQLDGNLGSSTKLADALYEALSAGVEPAKAIDFVATSAKLASAQLFDAGDSARLLATVMNAYGKEAGTAAHISDVFSQTIKIGVVRGGELAHALGNVISTAAQAKVPIEDIGAAIAIMTRAGIDADTATTSLNRAMLAFIDPSVEAKKVAHELGIELNAQELAHLGLKGAIDKVVKATDGNLEAQAALFGDVRAFKAALALTGAQAGIYADTLKDMKNAVGVTDEAFRRQQDNIKTQWSNIWNDAQRVVDRFVMTQGGPLVEAMKTFDEALKNGGEGLKDFAIDVGLVALAWAAWRNADNIRQIVTLAIQAGQTTVVVGELAGGVGGLTVTTWSLTAAMSALGTALMAIAVPLAFAALAYEVLQLVNATMDWIRAKKELKAAQELEMTSTDRAIASLKEHGIVIDKTGKTENQLSEEISRGGQILIAAAKAREDYAKATEKSAKAAEDAAPKVKKLTDEEQKLVDKFKVALAPADDLNKELKLLESQHMKSADVIAIYRREIVAAAEAQREHGIAVTGLVARYEAQAKAAIDTAESTKKLKDEVESIVKSFSAEELKAPALVLAIKELSANGATADLILKRLGDDIVKVNDAMLASKTPVPFEISNLANLKKTQDALEEMMKFKPEFKPVQPILPLIAPTALAPPINIIGGKALENIADARKQAAGLDEAIQQLSRQGLLTADTIAALGGDLDTAGKNAKEFGIKLDPATLALIRQREEAKKNEEEAKQWEQAWSNAMAQIVVDFAKGITDVIFGAKSMKDALKGIATETGKSFVENFFAELFKPLQKQFAAWGKQLAGLVNGVLSKITGGIGSKIGSFLGIGGSAVPHLAGGAAGPVLGTAGAAGSTAAGAGGLAAAMGPAGSAGSIGVLGLSGAATLGIGAAIGAAALIANHYIGAGRKQASVFTGQTQNEFGRNLGNVVDEFNAKKAGGTLTLDEAKALRDTLTSTLGDVTQAANEFAKGGKNQRKVVDQFFAQQDQIFGRNWQNLRSGFDTTIADLQSAADAKAATLNADGTPKAAMAGIPQTGLAASASTTFADAVKDLVPALGQLTAAITTGLAGTGSALPPVSVYLSVENNFSFDVGDVTIAEIRDTIIPGITDVLETGLRGVREKWSQIISDSLNGVVSNVTATPA